jgi:uncharacterized membrane protein YqjE
MRRLGCSLMDLLHTRAEWFTVELQEEKLRAIRLLVWVAAAVTLGVAGLSVAIAGLALYVWDVAGYRGLTGLAAVAIVMAAIILWIIQRRITQSPVPFAATVAEFMKDVECLRQRP